MDPEVHAVASESVDAIPHARKDSRMAANGSAKGAFEPIVFS